MKKTGYDQFFKAARKAKQPNHMPTAKRKRPFPIIPVSSGIVIILLALGCLIRVDLVEGILDRVQIRFMGQLAAEEKPSGQEKAATPAVDTAAKNSVPAGVSKTGEKDDQNASVSEDFSYIDKLRTRKEELDLREKELNQLEEELQRQKVEVDARIHQLEQMRRDIAGVLKERVESDETQVNKLVDLYSSMKPKQAADIIGSLQEDLAVQVLGKMKKKNAAEVMNLLPADKARGLSEKLTGYKR